MLESLNYAIMVFYKTIRSTDEDDDDDVDLISWQGKVRMDTIANLEYWIL